MNFWLRKLPLARAIAITRDCCAACESADCLRELTNHENNGCVNACACVAAGVLLILFTTRITLHKQLLLCVQS